MRILTMGECMAEMALSVVRIFGTNCVLSYERVWLILRGDYAGRCL